MSFNYDVQRERDDALFNDSLSMGQLESAAISEFAHNAGQDHPESAWLLTDRDVWVANPNYTGEPVPHPESGDDGYEDDGQPSTYEEYQDLYGGDDWDHGQYDDVPF